MTYGAQVFTGTSKIRISPGQKTVRVVHFMVLEGATSGSTSIPEFDSNKGFIGATRLDRGSRPVDYSWNNSTKTFSWDVLSETELWVVFVMRD